MPRAPWGDLFLLLAVAQAGSFRKAAQQLNSTQGTLSRRVEALEDRFGTTFLRRLNSGVELTEPGELAVDYIVTMARAQWDMEEALSQFETEVMGAVTVSCGEALAVPFLSRRIKELQRAHPKLIVDLITQLPIQEPGSGASDLAVLYDEPKNLGTVTSKLGTMHYCIFGSKEYFDVYGPVNTLQEVLNHRVIIHTHYANFDDSWSGDVESLHNFVKFCMKTDSGTCLLQATANGAALAIMPSFMGAYDDRLIMADVPPLASIRFWLAYRESQREVARIRTTTDWIKEVFNRGDNPWFRDEFVHPSEF
ncbi:MAG: LysR family transcriptional regulator [Caulobacterales bacterium]|nr:LysR family transcriptional regulator [Caulobacterales bacterium]